MKAYLNLLSACFAAAICGANANAVPPASQLVQGRAMPAGLARALPIMQATAAKRIQQVEDNAPGDFPSRDILPANELSLIIENGQAKVCQLKTAAIVCAAVEAPVPLGMMVNYWHLPDGNGALTYTRIPGVGGVPDPNSEETLRFQAAFNGATRAVLTTSIVSLRNDHGQTPRAMVCENEDCVDTDEGADEDGGGFNGDTGGGGGGGGGGSGGGGGGSGNHDGGGNVGDIQTVIVRGSPDPIATIPVFSSIGNLGAEIPLLLPSDQLQEVAAVLNPCVVSPIISVCVHGRRPPPLPGEVPLPNGAQPWFPQSWCNWSHVFCSAGQEPRDDDRGIDSDTSGKTKAELDEICVRKNIVEIDVCKAHFPKWRSSQFREFSVCKENANRRMYACFATADRLTDFGQHPAP